jgi:hypothetical protein
MEMSTYSSLYILVPTRFSMHNCYRTGLMYLHSICFLLLGHSPAKVSNKCSLELLELDACVYEPLTKLHISVVFNHGML